jgi:hypothetical protein
MQNKFTNFFSRNEILLQVFLFALFLATAIPGVKWGTPNLWNPDEMVWRASNALNGELIFDETEPDFNYPSLPKYVMYSIGKVVYWAGYTRADFIVAARVFSALLGAISAVAIYQLAKTIGLNAMYAFLAGLLYIASGVAPANGRFAHNDLYLQLFSIACVYFAIKYQFTKARGWIYESFFCVGLAASSKFTGGSMLLVPLIVFVFMNWAETRRDLFRAIETLFISAVLCYGGYILGTPKAFLWVAYYFKRVIPALLNYPQYGFNSGSPIGLIGQWGVFESAVGTFAYLLFIFCFIWFTLRLIAWKLGKTEMENSKAQAVMILMLTVLIFDLPFLSSVNYIPRYFIPFVPFLSVLGALFINEVIDIAQVKKWNYAPLVILIALVVGISYSMLRLTSTALLFMNDARIPAGEYVAALQGAGKTIEYTLYPPNVEKKQFSKAYNYPIYFVKYAADIVPTGGRYEYNLGEQGLLKRETDYLIVDSFTYSRFYTESICKTNIVECDFFKKLIANEIPTFRLIKEFSYTLPSYLPDVEISAVNPEIKIYERVR